MKLTGEVLLKVFVDRVIRLEAQPNISHRQERNVGEKPSTQKKRKEMIVPILFLKIHKSAWRGFIACDKACSFVESCFEIDTHPDVCGKVFFRFAFCGHLKDVVIKLPSNLEEWLKVERRFGKSCRGTKHAYQQQPNERKDSAGIIRGQVILLFESVV